jgi:hypothetical protein
MFISCGMIGYNRQLADDKALEVMLHNAPAEGNTVYERDIEKYVNTVRAKTLEALQMLMDGPVFLCIACICFLRVQDVPIGLTTKGQHSILESSCLIRPPPPTQTSQAVPGEHARLLH